ncbi:lysylphosphatidylglycerol synthase transmembrane domain-containing protein [Legionella rowbothamii]|uniref:lysylphosphatidylglycerol synthase transmembrane domain-containing protein n=1 Tax=Legionella rowbothamii TaxID=96229 RepID=UPI001054B6CB|nr:lysylphosphatidylglycerol synthase transmembrane domain-containing protein [Legionella rowbothamii]
MGDSPINVKKILPFSGFVIAPLFLFYTCWHMDWNEFISVLKNIETKWALAMMFALLASMFLRSLRWQIIAALPWSDTGKVWKASCAGYFGSAIYPAKAGEVLKIVRIQQLTGIRGGEAVVSALFDRIIDAITLFLLLAILVSTKSGYFNVSSTTKIAIWGLIVLLTGVTFYCIGERRLEQFWLWIASKNKMGKWLYTMYQEFLAGLQLLKLKRFIAPCLILQLIITFLDVAACWLLFYALGWTELPIIAAVTVLVYLAAIFCVPATPGYIGVYQIAAIFALASFGINKSEAVVYGTVFQIIAFILAVGVEVERKLNQFLLKFF